MKTHAAIIKESGQPFSIEEVELAGPKAGELLVEMVAVGVCHTDAVAQHQIIPVPLPAVFGHEGSGIVEAVGEGVVDFKAGDHVGMSYGYCGRCKNCIKGKPFLCEIFNDINFGGVMADGTKRLSQNGKEISAFFGQSSFARHVVVSERSVIKVDDDIDLSIVGPLGCGIQTGAGAVFNRIKPEFGSTIAIFGLGTVGMSALMAAKIAGCKQIIAIGGNPESLALAEELGATHTINRKETGDVVGEIKKITEGRLDYSIDTSGVPDFVKKALASVGMGGTAVVLGATGDLTINVQEELMGDSKSLVGVVEGDSIPKVFIPKLIEFYRDGKFPFDRLIKRYDFKDINQAFKDSKDGKVIKAVLEF